MKKQLIKLVNMFRWTFEVEKIGYKNSKKYAILNIIGYLLLIGIIIVPRKDESYVDAYIVIGMFCCLMTVLAFAIKETKYLNQLYRKTLNNIRKKYNIPVIVYNFDKDIKYVNAKRLVNDEQIK